MRIEPSLNFGPLRRRNKRWTALVGMSAVIALISTGCGSTSKPVPTDAAESENVVEEGQDATNMGDDGDDLEASDDDTADVKDFDSLEETMRDVLGAETAISRSNLSLESQETKLRISGEETLGSECVDASEEYIEFAQQEAEHMSAIVDEGSSITPGSPPDLESVVVEAYSTLEDRQEADNLQVTSFTACEGADAQLDETQRSVDGRVLSIISNVTGEGLLGEPVTLWQEVIVQEGNTRFTYRYQPDSSSSLSGNDLGLSEDELFEKAGSRLLEIIEG